MEESIAAITTEYQKSAMMKGIGLTQKPKVGTVPDEIQELTIPIPEKGESEVLVKIVASTLHVDDIALAQGTALGRFLGPKEISKDNPYILGSSFSGIIVDKGEAVTDFKIGDEVIGIPNKVGEHGSWATYRCIDSRNIRLKPKEMSHQTVVAMILAGCVAYGMVLYSQVKKGDNCLVIGASGGIGSTLIQILKAKGAIVTALCSTRNIDKVKSRGADFVIDYKKENFRDTLAAKNKQMDLVFDSVGGEDLERDSLKVLHKYGKFLTVCGPIQYIGSEKLSWLRVAGMFWHVVYRSIVSKLHGPLYQFSEKLPEKTIDEMLDFVIQNNIKVPVDRIIHLNLAEIQEALKQLAAHKVSGRIVIDLSE